MISSTLKPHTNAHTVSGRPTLELLNNRQKSAKTSPCQLPGVYSLMCQESSPSSRRNASCYNLIHILQALRFHYHLYYSEGTLACLLAMSQ